MIIMRIGIFGGSFDPPHKMHENIAVYLKKNNILDKIIFIPTGKNYQYKKYKTTAIDRYNMIKLITDKYDYMEVSHYELQKEEIHSYQTLKHYEKLYPEDTIYFICGLDNLNYLEDWDKGNYILNDYKILVIDRNTNNLKDILHKLAKYQNNIEVLNIKCDNISSTLIREGLEEEKEYLDKDVFAYIKKHHLYEEE